MSLHPWPKESLFDRAISRENGLFIFIKTVVRALESCKDPTETLEAVLQDSDGTGLKSLYGLYSSVLRARLARGNVDFQRMIGVHLATAPYRPLCKETIGELAGVKPNLAKSGWMTSALCYIETSEPIKEFVSDMHRSPISLSAIAVNLGDANGQLGIASLKTMVKQLHFNIRKLEDSRLPNTAVQDLPP